MLPSSGGAQHYFANHFPTVAFNIVKNGTVSKQTMGNVELMRKKFIDKFIVEHLLLNKKQS